jgi:hypothetical protein
MVVMKMTQMHLKHSFLSDHNGEISWFPSLANETIPIPKEMIFGLAVLNDGEVPWFDN